MARIQSPRPKTPETSRVDLVEDLLKALRGTDDPDGPIIFEIAQGHTDYFQVVIIWERWVNLSADARNRIVMDAYEQHHQERPDEVSELNISMILPVTAEQAIDLSILPYPVWCNFDQHHPRYPDVQALMKGEGAIQNGSKTELRLPTIEMARAARDRFREKTKDWTPRVHWTIWEQGGPIWNYDAPPEGGRD